MLKDGEEKVGPPSSWDDNFSLLVFPAPVAQTYLYLGIKVDFLGTKDYFTCTGTLSLIVYNDFVSEQIYYLTILNTERKCILSMEMFN